MTVGVSATTPTPCNDKGIGRGQNQAQINAKACHE